MVNSYKEFAYKYNSKALTYSWEAQFINLIGYQEPLDPTYQLCPLTFPLCLIPQAISSIPLIKLL